MGVKLKNISTIMEKIAPSYLAEKWDNVGLQIGNESRKVKKILVALEVTNRIIDEAIDKKVDMIICHHPLIFKSIKNIHTLDPIGNLIYRLIQNDIALYCAHTNLDSTKNGTNDVLAQYLQLTEVKPLIKDAQDRFLKLVVYVPKTHVEEVRKSMGDNDAGHIGNYSHCTFSSEGEGTFLPLEGTNPYIGHEGQLQKVKECRLETIVSKSQIHKVIGHMLKVHPYEEVAYDVIPLHQDHKGHGLGRVGVLKEPMKLKEFCDEVKEQLNIKAIKFVGDEEKIIKRVGLCTGSGAEFMKKAYGLGCDAYITGDVKYHDAQYAKELGMVVIDAGHYETEVIVCKGLATQLKEMMNENEYDVEIILGLGNKNPFQIR